MIGHDEQKRFSWGLELLSMLKNTRNLTGKTSAVSHLIEPLKKPQESCRDLAKRVDKMQQDTLGSKCRAWLWRWGKESHRKYISSDTHHFSLCVMIQAVTTLEVKQDVSIMLAAFPFFLWVKHEVVSGLITLLTTAITTHQNELQCELLIPVIWELQKDPKMVSTKRI